MHERLYAGSNGVSQSLSNDRLLELFGRGTYNLF